MTADAEEISPKGRPVLKEPFVEKLIGIPKYIPRDVKEPFKLKENNGHLKSSVELVCDTPGFRFTLSTRKLIKDPLDFSVVFTFRVSTERVSQRRN